MRSFRAVFVIVACLLGMASSASARKRTASDDARRTLRAYAECTVENQSVASRTEAAALKTLVSASPASREAAEAELRLRNSWCVDPNAHTVDELGFSLQLLRGELFRAMYLAKVGRKVVPAMRPIETLPAWRLADEDRYTPLQLFGECIAHANPQASQRILIAPTASDAEDAAYAALLPSMRDCVPPKQTIHFSRTLLEGVIAEGLFHCSGASL